MKNIQVDYFYENNSGNTYLSYTFIESDFYQCIVFRKIISPMKNLKLFDNLILLEACEEIRESFLYIYVIFL